MKSTKWCDNDVEEEGVDEALEAPLEAPLVAHLEALDAPLVRGRAGGAVRVAALALCAPACTLLRRERLLLEHLNRFRCSALSSSLLCVSPPTRLSMCAATRMCVLVLGCVCVLSCMCVLKLLRRCICVLLLLQRCALTVLIANSE